MFHIYNNLNNPYIQTSGYVVELMETKIKILLKLNNSYICVSHIIKHNEINECLNVEIINDKMNVLNVHNNKCITFTLYELIDIQVVLCFNEPQLYNKIKLDFEDPLNNI